MNDQFTATSDIDCRYLMPRDDPWRAKPSMECNAAIGKRNPPYSKCGIDSVCREKGEKSGPWRVGAVVGDPGRAPEQNDDLGQTNGGAYAGIGDVVRHETRFDHFCS